MIGVTSLPGKRQQAQERLPASAAMSGFAGSGFVHDVLEAAAEGRVLIRRLVSTTRERVSQLRFVVELTDPLRSKSFCLARRG